MERLTIPDEKIDGGTRRTVIDTRKVKEHAMTIYWALKKYEDTRLNPEQIMELKERDTAKAVIITGYNRAVGCKVGECPKCGTMSRDYMNFCNECGQRLKWEEES